MDLKPVLFFATLIALLALDAACVYATWMFFALGRNLQPGPLWLGPTALLVVMSMVSGAALAAVFAMRRRSALRLAIAAGPIILMGSLIALVLVVYPDG